MNNPQNNFIYLSQIIDLPVVNLNNNEKLGYVYDVTATLRELYPKINALVIKKKFGGKKLYIPWGMVKKVVEGKVIFIGGEAGNFENQIVIPENEILLKEVFWDKQIVDISGAKVVRVNDLHLLREELNIWVVHIDIGFNGLLRRLGILKPVESAMQWLFSYQFKDGLIGWKYVQPITTVTSASALSLKVPHTKLAELHPADLADIITDLGVEERVVILETLDHKTAAETLPELPKKIAVLVAEMLKLEHLVHILNEMPIDEVVDLVAELPARKLKSIFGLMPKEKVAQINTLLQHSKRIAGSLMNTEFISTKPNVLAGQLMEKIKIELNHKELIYYVYVLDDADVLVGLISLRQLLVSPPEKPVSEFMHKRVTRVKVDADVKFVARQFSKYNFMVIPVVDRQNKMLGIITMKDAFETVFPEVADPSGVKK
jgi:CBS domain-containing protein